MTAEEFYKQQGWNPPMMDKWDKRIQQFSFEDLVEFAEQYCEWTIKHNQKNE